MQPLGDDQFVFFFKFGAVVFFNVPLKDQRRHLLSAGITPRERGSSTPDDDEDYAVDDFNLNVETGMTKVGFNSLTLPALNISQLQLTAQVLAQSSALELVEHEAATLLAESERLSHTLREGRMFTRKRHKLLQFLGEALEARHQIVNQLALFKEPDITWDKEDLYQVYIGLIDNFDIKQRIEKIEKMLEIFSDVTRLLLEMINTRRSEIMELIIIALILFEILQAFR